MVQRSEDLCFTGEVREAFWIVPETLEHDLQRHTTFQLRVARATMASDFRFSFSL